MENRNKIVKFCEEYLQVKNFKDYCHNGLQVEGAEKISKIITGVSFSQKLIKAAIEKNAQMIIVHHGIFNKHLDLPLQFKGIMKNRLKLLFQNDINLCGFHLPLDAHPIVGNNISLIKLLGLKKIGVIDTPDYGAIGFIGKFQQIMDFEKFVKLVDEKLNTKAYTIQAGHKKVKKVGIISGRDPDSYNIVAELGADTFLTGEIKESIVRAVEETGINFISAGHYNTEKLGVQNLGKLIAKKFRVKAEFIDIPCDI